MWPRWARGGVAAAAVILVVTAVVWFAGRDAGLGTRAFRSPAVATSSPESPRMLPAVVRGLEIECMGAGKLLQASVRRDGARAQSIAESLHLGVSDVDRCIEETLAALEARPDDPRLVKQLTFRYQQKLDLLLGAMRRVEDV